MVYNFISLCISVPSVPSVVKQKKVETFNHREHRGHRDTQRTFVLLYHIYFDYPVNRPCYFINMKTILQL
jgi:hypothetical protein